MTRTYYLITPASQDFITSKNIDPFPRPDKNILGYLNASRGKEHPRLFLDAGKNRSRYIYPFPDKT